MEQLDLGCEALERSAWRVRVWALRGFGFKGLGFRVTCLGLRV